MEGGWDPRPRRGSGQATDPGQGPVAAAMPDTGEGAGRAGGCCGQVPPSAPVWPPPAPRPPTKGDGPALRLPPRDPAHIRRGSQARPCPHHPPSFPPSLPDRHAAIFCLPTQSALPAPPPAGPLPPAGGDGRLPPSPVGGAGKGSGTGAGARGGGSASVPARSQRPRPPDGSPRDGERAAPGPAPGPGACDCARPGPAGDGFTFRRRRGLASTPAVSAAP